MIFFSDKDNKLKTLLPFMGAIPKEDFEEFKTDGIIKEFPEYIYINNKKEMLNTSRKYVIGTFEIEKVRHK